MRSVYSRAGTPAILVALLAAEVTGAPGSTLRPHRAPPREPARSITSDVPPFATPWLPPSQRRRIGELDVEMHNQDGTSVNLARPRGMPTALSFFYTRCGSPGKCARTVEAMATLHRLLERSEWGNQVRTMLVTFDPESDTIDDLKRFGESRGLPFGPGMMCLRTEAERLEKLADALEVPVNYGAHRVNTHGLALYLIDGEGRLVRKYHTLLWDNRRVLMDLRRLVEEAAHEPAAP